MTRIPATQFTPSGRVLVALMVIGLMGAGCAITRMGMWNWKMPGVGTDGTVVDVTKRGTYLDGTLQVRAEEYRFLFPANYRCTQIIKPEAKIEFATIGHIPVVRGPGGDCDPIGILSLQKWVARHRRQITPARTEADVEFEVFYQDDEVAFARGRFEFANRVVFRESRGAGLERPVSVKKNIGVIVVIPVTAACEKPLAEGQGHAQFRPEEQAPFRLVVGDEVCPILGLARISEPPKAVGGGTKFD